MEGAEKDCNILGSLFNAIINDLRVSHKGYNVFVATLFSFFSLFLIYNDCALGVLSFSRFLKI